MKTRLYNAINEGNVELASNIIAGRDKLALLEQGMLFLARFLFFLVILNIFMVPAAPFWAINVILDEGPLALLKRSKHILLSIFSFKILRKEFYLNYFEIGAPGEEKDSLLNLAIKKKLGPVINGLIELGIDVNREINYDYFNSDYPLITALETEQYNVATSLVMAGADPDVEWRMRNFDVCLTPVYRVVGAENYNLEFIRFLISKGVAKDLNSRVKDIINFKLNENAYEVHIHDHSLLLHAIFTHHAYGGSPELVQGLIDAGVDINHVAYAKTWVKLSLNMRGESGIFERRSELFSYNNTRVSEYDDILTPLKAALCLNQDQNAIILLLNGAQIQGTETTLNYAQKVKALTLALQHGIELTDYQISENDKRIMDELRFNNARAAVQQEPEIFAAQAQPINRDGNPRITPELRQETAPVRNANVQRLNIFSRTVAMLFRPRTHRQTEPVRAAAQNEEVVGLLNPSVQQGFVDNVVVPAVSPLPELQGAKTAIDEAFAKLQEVDPTFTRDDDRFLKSFKCPYHLELFTNPYSVTETGSTVDKEPMDEWFRACGNTPRDPIMTGMNLQQAPSYYGPNFILRQAILEHLEHLKKEAIAKNGQVTSRNDSRPAVPF